MENSNIDWQSAAYRQSIVDKMFVPRGRKKKCFDFRIFVCLFLFHSFSDEAMQNYTGVMQRSGSELENNVFVKARTREDYMNLVNKLILHCKSECSIEHRSARPTHR